jgi:hypothetical protein
MDKLAKTIAVPRDYRAERIPTFPALERTGVLSFTDTNTVTVPSESSLAALVCRDPAYPVWVTSRPSPSSYSFYSVLTGTGDDFVAPANSHTPIPLGALSNFYTNSGSSFTALDYSMPVIKYRENEYFYNTTGFGGIQFTFNSAPGSVTVTLAFETLNSVNNLSVIVYTLASVVVVNGAGLIFTLPTDCMAFRMTSLSMVCTSATVCTCSAYGVTTQTTSIAVPLSVPTGTAASVLFPLSKPVEAVSTTVPWKAVRSTAVGALFSNVTAVLNKEGTVKAARLSTEVLCPLSYLSYDTAINKVYPKDRYFGAMENGLYTFTLPDLGSEIYRDTLNMGSLSVIPTWVAVPSPPGTFDLDKLSYANIISFTDIGTADTTLAVTVDRHIEFRSSSVLFPLGYSAIQLEAYHAAQMALVQLGVFFENPLHLGLIGAAVAQAVRTVASYAYPVVRQVGQAALAAAGDKLLNMANKKLGQMSQAKMVKQPPPKQRQLVPRKKIKVQKKK